MATTAIRPGRVPTMNSAVDDFINGPTISKKNIILKGRVAKNSKYGKPKTGGNVVVAKKAVNSFVIFRAMMSPIFPNWTQADRSRFVRTMWTQEQHKDSYSLMARVWTFIRDNSNFRALPKFLNGAGKITNIVTPENWLNTYNMQLVRMPDFSIQLVQNAPPAAGRIPPPATLGDFDLLHALLLKGLPVEHPTQLLRQMCNHSLHVMVVNKQMDFSVNDETIGAHGRNIVNFSDKVDYNPISACAELLELENTDSLFDNGVNVFEIDDIANFDPAMITTIGPHTHYRFEWDTTSAHHARPGDGAIDTNKVESVGKLYDLDMPNMFQGVDNTMSQREYEDVHGPVGDIDMSSFFMSTSFDDAFPGLNLQ